MEHPREASLASARGVAALTAGGALVALAGILFPTLLRLDGRGQLGALAIHLATGTALGADPSGWRILDAARRLDGGFRDPVVLGILTAVGSALFVLLGARAPRLARGLAFVGMAGVATVEIAPRLVAADARGWLSTLAAGGSPGLGYYVALAGFGVAILAGTFGRRAR